MIEKVLWIQNTFIFKMLLGIIISLWFHFEKHLDVMILTLIIFHYQGPHNIMLHHNLKNHICQFWNYVINGQPLTNKFIHSHNYSTLCGNRRASLQYLTLWSNIKDFTSLNSIQFKGGENWIALHHQNPLV